MQETMYLGNLDAKRDWGHAKDYVEAMWLMLQQDEPEDFVIATGKQISVREFVRMSAENLGIELEFTGTGVGEVATVKSITGDNAKGVKVGDVIVKVDTRYFRPAEVETLLGDPSKAKEKLGWQATTSCKELAQLMVDHDLKLAQQEAVQKV